MPTFFELANGLKGYKDQANTQNGQGSIFTTHKDNVGWVPPSINRYHPWKHINLLSILPLFTLGFFWWQLLVMHLFHFSDY